jgi:HEAT repeat protein
MVRCLGRIGYTLEHKRAILRYLDHPDYTVRFNAVQAMYKLDDESRQLLLDFNTKMNGILSGAIEHVSEPLLL